MPPIDLFVLVEPILIELLLLSLLLLLFYILTPDDILPGMRPEFVVWCSVIVVCLRMQALIVNVDEVWIILRWKLILNLAM